jgi:hypothetical protein
MGQAGMGKSLLILFIVLMAMYGNKEVKHPMQILYFVNYNSAVNDFALRVDAEKVLVEMGKADAVVRLTCATLPTLF